MAFTLDKTQGKGKATVKVTPGVNRTGNKIRGQILVQVNGITKQVVQLVQRAAAVYKVFIQTDKTNIGAAGGDIKVTYWVTLNGEITDDIPIISGITDTVNSGVDSEGRQWLIDRVPANSGGVTYTAKFEYEEGKEVSAQATVLPEVGMYLTIDNPYVSGKWGGAAIFSYWSVENGVISGDNLELVFESEGSADVEFQLGPASKDSSGKITQSITLPANTVNEVKELKFHTRNTISGYESDTLVVSLLGKDMTVLPDFDFFCFSYRWSEEAGKDLDSATLVVGSQIPIGGEDSGKTLDDYFVGYGGNGNSIPEVQQYIKHGGDNTQSGAEGALINWKEICNRDLLSKGITKLYAYIYGNWYDAKDTGDMTFYFRTYRGTGMIQEGYEFRPDEGTELVTEFVGDINCNAFSHDNSPGGNLENMRKWYSLLATIEYDVATSSAAFKPNLVKSGRSITSSVELSGSLDGQTLSFGNSGRVSRDRYGIPDQQNVPITVNWSNAKELIDIDPNTGSASNNDMYVSEEPIVSVDWLDVNFIKDASNHITGMTFKASDNDTGSNRSTSIDVKFKPSVRNIGANILTLTISQMGLY